MIGGSGTMTTNAFMKSKFLKWHVLLGKFLTRHALLDLLQAFFILSSNERFFILSPNECCNRGKPMKNQHFIFPKDSFEEVAHEQIVNSFKQNKLSRFKMRWGEKGNIHIRMKTTP